jgi:hypothetical protein
MAGDWVSGETWARLAKVKMGGIRNLPTLISKIFKRASK